MSCDLRSCQLMVKHQGYQAYVHQSCGDLDLGLERHEQGEHQRGDKCQSWNVKEIELWGPIWLQIVCHSTIEHFYVWISPASLTWLAKKPEV